MNPSPTARLIRITSITRSFSIPSAGNGTFTRYLVPVQAVRLISFMMCMAIVLKII